MNSGDFKRLARENLNGRRGKAAIAMLIFTLCSWGIALLSSFIPVVGQIAVAIITPVLSYGFLKQWIKFKNKEDVGYVDFFSLGFADFKRVWGVTLIKALKMILPLLLIIIGYIVMFIGVTLLSNNTFAYIISFILIIAGFAWMLPIMYKYMFVINELAYNSERTSKEIVEESGKYMIGNRFKAFCLIFSFLGWMILSGVLFAIPLFWVIPYMQISMIIFYEHVSGKTNENKEEVIPEMPNIIVEQEDNL